VFVHLQSRVAHFIVTQITASCEWLLCIPFKKLIAHGSFEIALVIVRLDDIATITVNANHRKRRIPDK
jgi:hypothetical protein